MNPFNSNANDITYTDALAPLCVFVLKALLCCTIGAEVVTYLVH